MQTSELFAHTPPDGSDRWHGLEEHLLAVADLAERFGSKFGLGQVCRELGLAHDAGKADPRFQSYLSACHKGLKTDAVPHSWPAAKAAYRRLSVFALAIAGHHGGLPNASEWRTKIDIDPEAVRCAESLLTRLSPQGPGLPNLRDPLQAEMAVRMALSALVDADRLDTERHWSAATFDLRGGFPKIGWYVQALEEHWRGFQAEDTPVNRIRAEVLARCRERSESDTGSFRLTVPTGGGKTLAGLTFALLHAARNGMDRVIVAAPYTSILDQTAGAYERIFGRDRVLVHATSLPEPEDEEQSLGALRRRLGAENWDCPLVLTTTVQLFESLLSNKPGKCRKLHNVARSVIVLDEVQTLPTRLLGPILDVLRDLVQAYGCSVVFCTATQPDYDTVDARLISQAEEIVPEHPRHFQEMRRVEYRVEGPAISEGELALRLIESAPSLAVLNRRKDAIRVLEALRGLEPEGLRVLHLSTLLHPEHRRRVLAEVRSRLAAGERICLVSTQVVEAGVDLDFPVVFRDMGPLDRIIQTAGRCNREGRLKEGVCHVVRLKGSGVPKGDYALATEISSNLLSRGMVPDDPQTMAEFWRQWLTYSETGSLEKERDKAGIQRMRQEMMFRSVGESFRMIEQDTEPVLVAQDASELLESWRTTPPKKWFRSIAPFCVNVFKNELRKLQDIGCLTRHESGVWLYIGRYDELTGIHAELPDVADLVC